MWRLLGFCAALLLFEADAHAQEFKGSLVVTSTSGTCSQYNPVGQSYVVRWQPRNGTRPNSKFALFGNVDYGQSFELSNAEFDGTSRAVFYGSMYAGLGTVAAGSTNPPAVKVTFSSINRVPSATTTSTTTNFVNIQGVITNFDKFTFISGCNANFRMSLARQSP